MWVCLADEDVIYIDPTTSPLHQQQIGLHEIAHVICDHRDCSAVTDGYDGLFLSLDPDMVTSVLGRTTYGDRQEREAEMIATLLGERIVVEASAPLLTTPDGQETDQVLAELRRALGGKGGAI